MVPSLSIPDSNICRELDDMVLQYLALVDEHLAVWNRISDRFQQGREQISQAKYIMGPKNVSADCYDLRMKALRGVAVSGLSDIVLRDLWAEQQLAAKEAMDGDQDQARSRQANENEDGTIDIMEDQSLDGRAGLRRRGGAASGATSVASNEEDKLVDDEKLKKMANLMETLTATGTTTPTNTPTTTVKKKERNPDPLLWFGVFVPGPLRNAQDIFQKGT
ncbi:hypothetical protein BGX21_003521 [Mortierella sp. AD011]|nr:hypothetical protein BGX20_009735 [Mortierella sp. AD010]KAF9376304.1 hypothetical protein BGX21_003521 [Mortierella sp. AD011]